jgi:dihydrolipoamide dehydrogenase
MSLVEVKVPDIGDFKDVDVIEVNIKPGDVIEIEQALMTLESDKASIEVPSDTAGTVKEVRVKAGDKVSEGTVIATVETSGEAAPAKEETKAAKEPAKAAALPLPQHNRPLRRPRRSNPLPRRKRAASPARPISNATWSCSARAPAVIRLRSARPISA